MFLHLADSEATSQKVVVSLSFPSQLLVQLGDVVVPLRLVAGACHGGPQPVLLPETLDLELSAVVPATVGEDGLTAGEAGSLLVHQPDIAMEP